MLGMQELDLIFLLGKQQLLRKRMFMLAGFRVHSLVFLSGEVSTSPARAGNTNVLRGDAPPASFISAQFQLNDAISKKGPTSRRLPSIPIGGCCILRHLGLRAV